MHRHMDAHPAARLCKRERGGQRCGSLGTLEPRRGAGTRGDARVLLHRARPPGSTVLGRHLTIRRET